MMTLSAARVLSVVMASAATLASAAEVSVKWLGETPPAMNSGVSFGVPWPQGAVPKTQAFTLTTADGSALPAQTWPLAYWPDGSVKWSGIATVVPAGLSGAVKVSTSSNVVAPSAALTVKQQGNASWLIDTGALSCVIGGDGSDLIRSLSIGGKEVATSGQLISILQSGPSTTHEDSPAREKFISAIKSVQVEQTGPVRAVVKIEGMHKGVKSGREWLPFSVRLYFYRGETTVRVVHTIIFDGDQEKDFVRGLGLQLKVAMHDAPQARYVRFAGQEGGLWSEPLQPAGGNEAQEAGQPFVGRGGFLENAIWDDFKLVQPNPEGFIISKRTNPASTWLFSAAGPRAGGFVSVGDLQSGVGVSIKNFWQSYPASLEINQASSSAATLTAWLWSPDAGEMDMRHYDIKAHGLGPSYEDVQPGMSTAFGVARTSELTLFARGALPSRAETVAMASAGSALPLLAASPEYIHSTGVFGPWALVDRSTPFKKSIEDGLDSVLAYYEKQVDQRHWYGFWQYGDFLHSYSAPRHQWHYDWGGHAWDNTELGTPLWLWYSFLRSGRADLFRLAEALTRNTSETNVYHLGPMTGLGSRHNVIKWGDGAKEGRVSQSAHWRPYFYLTTDERTGDIMRTMVHSDVAMAKYDPMREAEPQIPSEPQFAARIRIGPDWFALAGNWMTEWERTGEVKWRDRILAGVDSIVAMPYWLETGQLNGLNPDLPGGGIGPLKGGGSQTVGYDLATGKLTAIRDPIVKQPVPVSYNLATIQGGGEVMFELVPLLGRADFAKAWLQYCRIAAAPAEILTKDRDTGTEGNDARYVLTGQSGPRLAAYAYAQTKNPAFAKRALEGLLAQGGGRASVKPVPRDFSITPAEEAPGVSTNEAAQTGLSTIQYLEFCKDALPTEAAVWPVRTFGGPRRGGPPAGSPSTEQKK